MRKIPDGWKIHNLIDLVDLPSGQVDPTRKPYRDWPLIAPDHVESGSGRLIKIETAAEQSAASGKYIVQPGDVIYSKIRPALRKAVVAEFDGLCSADMYPLRVKEGVEPRFLLAVILGREFSIFADSVSGRSGIPKVNRAELADYRFAVPPLEEQRRIVEVLNILDDQRDCLNSMSRKAMWMRRGIEETVLGRLQPDSTLESALHGRPRNGLYVPSSYYGGVGTPIVRIDSIHNGEIRPIERLLRVDIGAGDVDAFRLEESDIAINRVNSIEYVGKSALVGARAEVMVYESNIMRCRVRKDRYRADYVAAWLSARIARGHFMCRAKSAVAQASINSSDVLSCPIPEIPLGRQDEIVRSLTAAKGAEVRVMDELAKLNLLKEGLVEDFLGGRVRV